MRHLSVCPDSARSCGGKIDDTDHLSEACNNAEGPNGVSVLIRRQRLVVGVTGGLLCGCSLFPAVKSGTADFAQGSCSRSSVVL